MSYVDCFLELGSFADFHHAIIGFRLSTSKNDVGGANVSLVNPLPLRCLYRIC